MKFKTILTALIVITFNGNAQLQLTEVDREPSVIEEPEWTALFDRDSGWTGSDATYSIPFSAYDAPGNPEDDTTMFLFGDTFIGEVDENNARKNSQMIRNSIGSLNTKSPVEDEISFHWETDDQNQPEALFKADTPNSGEGDWIWPMDGIRIDDRFYIYGLRLFDPSGLVSFEIDGVTLISFELDADHNIINYRQVDAPLFHKDDDGIEIVIGQAVMPMTAASGNPGADGYIYVYGPRNRPLNFKQMVVSRVQPEHIEDFEYYEFWDGRSWQSDITNCAVLTDSISQEFSVTPLNDGRFIAVFEFEGWVCTRYGDGITGPFEPVQYLYDCPEDTMYVGGYVYNAKAHPHLSDGGNLLISYNVNTSDYNELYDNADTYRPRFIRYFLPGSPSGLERVQKKNLPAQIVLYPNYPNPFNGETNIRYALSVDQYVELIIYDINGQKAATLIDGKQRAGLHEASWNANGLSSGVYFYRLKAGRNTQTRKLILMK
ncbi:MAG: DUF4185 domain-containing protein [Caldithrix sp.]|nr:DUF4185 domain-containing protein [Caldithrix sp.]